MLPGGRIATGEREHGESRQRSGVRPPPVSQDLDGPLDERRAEADLGDVPAWPDRLREVDRRGVGPNEDAHTTDAENHSVRHSAASRK